MKKIIKAIRAIEAQMPNEKTGRYASYSMLLHALYLACLHQSEREAIATTLETWVEDDIDPEYFDPDRDFCGGEELKQAILLGAKYLREI